MSGTPVRVTSVDWHLDVFYREKSFSGTVTIRLEDPPDPLVVDSDQLEILSAKVDGGPALFRDDPAKGCLEFPGVPTGAHQLEIGYRGKADPNSLVGMYVSPLGGGYALTTMLFPTGSRRLLPSFEDPSVKTVYRLVLTTDSEVKSLFNTPPVSERSVGNRRETIFAPTPPMSAYLLYLGVGPFDTITIPGTKWSVTVAAAPGRAEAGRFCGERASAFLAAYEAFYKIPYPLPKLDLIGLENFWAGAMENWGAISFREGLVLVDPKTTVLERRINLQVLAHEIAHQWFGNLVTPQRWDDFWLNESFATYVGHDIVAHRFPEECPWTYFMTRFGATSLREDSYAVTHPVRVPITSVEQLGEIADDVTYGKGAYVLRMVAAYVGPERFREGVSRYLSEHRYSNARAEDLWQSLADASDRPVGRVMTEWISRPGYPIVHAEWSGGYLLLRQERFRADGTPTPGTWPIPLRVVGSTGAHEMLFESPTWEIPFPVLEGFRINPERTAFARVHYDDRLFDQMLRDLGSWSPVDQWGALVDTQAFLLSGLVSLTRFLDFVRACVVVTDELPLVALAVSLAGLLVPLNDNASFRETARSVLGTHLKRIEIDRVPNEPETNLLLREVLVDALVRLDNGFSNEIAARFSEIDRVAPELRPSVALAYAISAGDAAFGPLTERLRTTPSDRERTQLMRALGGFRDPAILRRVLGLVPSPGVTPAGSVYLFDGIAANPDASRTLFDWYRESEEALVKMWAGTPLLSVFLMGCLPMMSLDREAEVDRHFRDNPPKDAVMAVGRALEIAQLWSRLRRNVGHALPR